MGTEIGVSEVERLHRQSIPSELKLFYRYPSFASFMKAHYDTDVFLEEAEPFPYCANWSQKSYLIVAELTPTEVEIGIEFNCENPEIKWGVSSTDVSLELPTMRFGDWIRDNGQELTRICDAFGHCPKCPPKSTS